MFVPNVHFRFPDLDSIVPFALAFPCQRLGLFFINHYRQNRFVPNK